MLRYCGRQVDSEVQIGSVRRRFSDFPDRKISRSLSREAFWLAIIEFTFRMCKPVTMYSCCVRDNSVYEVIENKPLTYADRKVGVVSDQIVKFTAAKADAMPGHPCRTSLAAFSSPSLRRFSRRCDHGAICLLLRKRIEKACRLSRQREATVVFSRRTVTGAGHC